MTAVLSKTFVIQFIDLDRSLEWLRFMSMKSLEGEMRSLEGEMRSFFTATYSERTRKSPSLFSPVLVGLLLTITSELSKSFLSSQIALLLGSFHKQILHVSSKYLVSQSME